METSMSQIPSPSRFLNLPLEIKNEIYAYVLICNMIPSYETGFRDRRHHEQDTGTSRSVAPNPNLTISGNPRTKLALLRVNRQIHDEAALMFYGQNVFPIEVSAMSRRPRAIGAMRPNQYVYTTSYTAPWERFGYQFVVDPEESTRYQDPA
ncbi:hypothetical protein TWF106_007094 [Orbilia oligospora]|uniref:Uncharacterized protein n=1 Tax=Orbilia oligospora TaxID=2813651 RepID=A0A7C8UZ63_ORBOL|nr:hypothetical protein TWF106_007094 [Orbilia oligospora]